MIDLLTPSQSKNMRAATDGYGVGNRYGGSARLRDELSQYLREGTLHSYIAKAIKTARGGMFWPELWEVLRVAEEEVDWTQPAFLEIADRERVFGSFQAFYSEMVEPWMGEWRRLSERYRRYAEAGTPEERQRERDETAAEITTRIQEAAKATTGDVLPQSPGINQYTGSGNLPGPTQSERAARSGVGTRTQRKLDHLARLRPDLLAEVRAGRKSVHRAATEAGIVKPPGPLDQLCSAWKRASPEQRDRFEQWIADFRRKTA